MLLSTRGPMHVAMGHACDKLSCHHSTPLHACNNMYVATLPPLHIMHAMHAPLPTSHVCTTVTTESQPEQARLMTMRPLDTLDRPNIPRCLHKMGNGMIHPDMLLPGTRDFPQENQIYKRAIGQTHAVYFTRWLSFKAKCLDRCQPSQPATPCGVIPGTLGTPCTFMHAQKPTHIVRVLAGDRPKQRNKRATMQCMQWSSVDIASTINLSNRQPHTKPHENKSRVVWGLSTTTPLA